MRSAVRFMSTFDHGERIPRADEHGEQVMVGDPWVERNIYYQDPELARRWALAIVEDAVSRKFQNYCYLKVQGIPGSYEQSWGFKSLLGAIWLQMRFLMRADRRC